MIIKYQAVAQHVRHQLHSVYIVTGHDHYLLNDAVSSIKKAWRSKGVCDEKIIDLDSADDWTLLRNEANSYSLFFDNMLLDARYEKKSLDVVGKKILTEYVLNVNSHCLLILRAPNIPNKQLLSLANNKHTVIVQIYPFSSAELQRWITLELQKRALLHAPKVPLIIHNYTQGNMLASAQLIEKLAIIQEDGVLLTETMVLEHLWDQCDYQLHELAEACLNANPEKVIRFLRQSSQNKTEPSLILWVLSQEIRQLIQLAHLCSKSMSFSTACNQLNIWSQRTKSYETTLARLSVPKLQEMLYQCHLLDKQIKSNQSVTLWHGLENLAVTLAAG